MADQFQNVFNNLAALGLRRLILLGLAGLLMVGSIVTGAVFVNRPAFETVYVGLERDDINRMGIVLADAGITYDVDSDGTSILVEAGKTSKARMILAEKGLPSSSGSGYELFDNLGSLGLTSFMQEVTRIRVLEGEIARSVQAISGIKAARVHIVVPDRRSFGNRNKEASASVLVSSNGSQPNKAALAIRHLVAAAVPQLSIENVTVLDANGQLLAAGGDPAQSMISSSMGIQANVENQLRDNIAVALTPYLGPLNFRVSVQATIDTNKTQTNETIFDPESRVERSVQVVKTQDSNSQKSAAEAVSVEQNLPNAEESATSGPETSQSSERREETTNYEVNSKRIATVSNGFTVKSVSASIVLNRKRIEDVLGADANADAINERLEQIKRVASAAAGINAERGDVIEVTAVEFMDDLAGAGVEMPGLVDKIAGQLGSMINSLAFLIGIVLMIFLGVRPIISTLMARPDGAPTNGSDAAMLEGGAEALPAQGEVGQLAAPDMVAESAGVQQVAIADETQAAAVEPTAQERLGTLTDENAEVSAQVLRQWALSEAA